MQEVRQDLRISSKMENISLVDGLIDDVTDKYHVGEQYGNIQTALLEAVTNAIVHGNKLDESKFVDISYSMDEENNKLCFVVKDQGKGFDPSVLPDPTAPENLEKLTGRGVFLMKALADEIEFEDNARTVKIYFKLAS